LTLKVTTTGVLSEFCSFYGVAHVAFSPSLLLIMSHADFEYYPLIRRISASWWANRLPAFFTLHGSIAPRRTVHLASWKLYDTTWRKRGNSNKMFTHCLRRHEKSTCDILV